jgi:hypothetical protein
LLDSSSESCAHPALFPLLAGFPIVSLLLNDCQISKTAFELSKQRRDATPKLSTAAATVLVMAVGSACLLLASIFLSLVILLGLDPGGAVDSVVPGGSRARDGGLTRCNL